MKISTRKYVNKIAKLHRREWKAEVRALHKSADKFEKTSEDAVRKVETVSADYRIQQNEWRGTIKDQSSMYLTKQQFWAGVIMAITLGAALGTLISKITT